MNKELYENLKKSYPDVTIVMASKYLTAFDDFKPFLSNGCRDFGENRYESLVDKQNMLKHETITWHFIGTLQTKKVKKALPYIDVLHSLDRIKLAKEIEKHHTGVLPCFVQVNISKESQKHGLKSEEVVDFVHELATFKHLRVIGLMGMATETDDESIIREEFRTLKQLRDTLNVHYKDVKELSMGMTQDYQIALEEGATLLRLGRILLQEAPYG